MLMVLIYIVAILGLSLLSFGFIDPGLVSQVPVFMQGLVQPLFDLYYHHRPMNTLIYSSLLSLLFFSYFMIVRKGKIAIQKILYVMGIVIFLFVLAYPALSYDMFNYITTSKVAFFHKENPYLIMPVEIPNEPYLAFTRAANKVALYGPVWILLTAIPWALGGGNIWGSIISFKLLLASSYIVTVYLIYRHTKDKRNVFFFALNPLVVVEVLLSGHNDLVMMAFALGASMLWYSQGAAKRVFALFLLLCSWFVKGSTIVLLPLGAFIKNKERYFAIGSLVLLSVGVVVGTLREEFYPWYGLWFLSFLAMLPWDKYKKLFGFGIVVSLGLELRHLPYMYMGYYEGVGPVLRELFTFVPWVLYIGYILLRKNRKHE